MVSEQLEKLMPYELSAAFRTVFSIVTTPPDAERPPPTPVSQSRIVTEPEFTPNEPNAVPVPSTVTVAPSTRVEFTAENPIPTWFVCLTSMVPPFRRMAPFE